MALCGNCGQLVNRGLVICLSTFVLVTTDTLTDDPEEAKSELAPIQVQQAVCMQRQGDNKEAMNIYTNIIKEK